MLKSEHHNSYNDRSKFGDSLAECFYNKPDEHILPIDIHTYLYKIYEIFILTARQRERQQNINYLQTI
jgi:hypothetical protein